MTDAMRRGEALGSPAAQAQILAEDRERCRDYLRRDDVRERIEAERKRALEQHDDYLRRIGSPAWSGYVPPKKKEG